MERKLPSTQNTRAHTRDPVALSPQSGMATAQKLAIET
jgi:hypothetical protein